MGGLGPGLGGTEILLIGLVALLVVGPKDLPVLMRKLGKLMAKARGMANEFRASFDEMARQSELDELRKEVEALRTNQGIHALGADADAAFRDIGRDLDSGLTPPPVPSMLSAPDEWPDAGPAMTPLEVEAPTKAKAKTRTKAKPRAVKATKASAPKATTKAAGTSGAKRTTASRARAAARPRTARSRKVDP
ncbi:Sec-independent protein translocase protein TatB [uncultured Brevundimonas sp.]|uniref:Sec-independent protein translocase protein TatB n=1 Tax=uncultured Brevundimonas sp. TaxID=213418 RepID=UPI0030EB2937|tara:strand:- start:1792 stop:2367 length:576 start_codon:yes stop_codon:yes gene_type:complete